MLRYFRKKNTNKQYKISYSQTGEDLIIDFFLNKEKGIYVDIGCNDPVFLNNTYFFYKKGWEGINVDANSKCIEKFNLVRKRDNNICALVSNSNKSKKFYIFDPETLSTSSEKQKNLYIKAGYKLKETKFISCLSLATLFNQELADTEIDFLSLDTEGNEKEILMSNDWKRYLPKFIILETLDYGTKEKNIKKFDSILKKYGYIKFADTFMNTIFISNQYLKKFKCKII